MSVQCTSRVRLNVTPEPSAAPVPLASNITTFASIPLPNATIAPGSYPQIARHSGHGLGTRSTSRMNASCLG